MTGNGPDPAEAVARLRDYYVAERKESPTMDDLGRCAERFIRLKQALGMRFEREAKELRSFVRFLGGRGVDRASALREDAVRAWKAESAERAPSGARTRVRTVGDFLGHLEVLGRAPVLELEPADLPRERRADYRPYIFTVDQLRLLLSRSELPGPWEDRAVMYTVLYACGLRVGEAARFRVRDFADEEGTLFIESSKSNKDRLLPVHLRIRDRLRRYREERRSGAAPDAPLFVDEEARAYTSSELSAAFHQDLVAWGLYEPTRVEGDRRYGSPRAYSLRHSFAIHRLLRWYREGADVQAKLPLLSTYMGHGSLRETQVYLKITGLLLREGNERFSGRWEKEFKVKP